MQRQFDEEFSDMNINRMFGVFIFWLLGIRVLLALLHTAGERLSVKFQGKECGGLRAQEKGKDDQEGEWIVVGMLPAGERALS